ncbi:hypothetical protein IT568_04505 [bacterium]|nr:hypothetical protein [bacterium]
MIKKDFLLIGIFGISSLIVSNAVLGNDAKKQEKTKSNVAVQTEKQEKTFKIIEHSKNKIKIKVTNPEPEFENFEFDGKTFVKFKDARSGFLQKTNYPEIPNFSYTLNIPSKNLAVRVLDSKSRKIAIKNPIKPVFEDVANYGTGSEAKQKPLLDYAKTTVYPSQIAEINREGNFRGNELVTLKISPYVYFPSQNSITFYSEMTLEVTFEEDLNSTKGVVNPDPSIAELELLSKTAENYREAQSLNFFKGKKNGSQLSETITNYDTEDKKIRMIVEEDGIYRITLSDIDKLGVSLFGLDPRYLKIYKNNTQIPVYFSGEADGVFDETDYFDFWGEKRVKTYLDKVKTPDVYQDPYSTENCYYISWKKDDGFGLRMVDENVAPTIVDNLSIANDLYTAKFFDDKIHLEEDRLFSRLGDVSYKEVLDITQRDHWFWTEARAFSTKAISINLPGLYADGSAEAKFTIALHGRTSGSHHVIASVNNQQVYNTSWVEQKLKMLYPIGSTSGTNIGTGGIAQSLLLEGINTVNLSLPGDTQSGENDVVLLNWIEIQYKRKLEAYENSLTFRKPESNIYGETDERFGVWEFNVKGFTNPDIVLYKKGISRLNGGIIGIITDEFTKEKTFRIKIQDEILSNEVEYIATTEEKIKKPKRFEANLPSDIKGITEQVDYLVISHPEFIGSKLDEFVELHENNPKLPLSTKVIDVMDIYDEFSAGHRSPEAIKSFLRFVYENWTKPAPIYVLLVGDNSWNGKLPEEGGGNFIPSQLLHTKEWGLAVSDSWYGFLDDDFLPEFLIGRFTVNDRFELQAVVDKSIEHITNPDFDETFNKILFISGGAGIFSDQNNVLIRDHLPSQFDVIRLNTSAETTENSSTNPDLLLNNQNLAAEIEKDIDLGGTSDLIDIFDGGISIINFMGHGGGAVWADQGLFRLPDVERTSNKGKYPFVTSMTCFAGAFDEPSRLSLSEKMMIEKDKGAIGVWASSGLGWTWNDFFISQEIWRPILLENQTFGQAIWQAKQDYLKKYSPDGVANPSDQEFSMITQYNLLGDPALSLHVANEKFVENSLELSDDNLTYGQDVVVSGEADFEIRRLKIAVTNSYGRTIKEFLFTPNSNNFSETITIPDKGPIAESNGNGTYSLKLTQNTELLLNTTSGFIKIYADNDDISDIKIANASIPFLVDGPSIISTAHFPLNPTERDSVYFHIFIEPNGKVITEIKCIGRYDTPNNFNASDRFSYITVKDTLNTKHFYTANPFVDGRGGTLIHYYFQITTDEGKIYKTNSQNYFLGEKLDFNTNKEKFWLSGEDEVKFNFSVSNNTPVAQNNIPLKFTFLRTDSLAFAMNYTINSIPSYSSFDFNSQLLVEQFDFIPGKYSVKAEIDPLNVFGEAIRQNNARIFELKLNHFNVTPALGTTLNKTTHSEVAVDDQIFIDIEPQKFTETGVLIISEKLMPNTRTQNLFVPYTYEVNNYPLKREAAKLRDEFLAYKIDFSKSEAVLEEKIKIKFALNPLLQDTIGTTQIAFYDLPNKRWLLLPTTQNGDFFETETANEGLYTLMNSTDDANKGTKFFPSVELNASGKTITDGSFVSSNAKVSLILQDESGINLNTIWVTLNGDTLDSNELVLPDSTSNPNIISIPLRVALNTIVSDYVVKYQVSDYAGNLLTDKQVTFRTLANTNLTVYGNFPNPFGDAVAKSIPDKKLGEKGTIFAFSVEGIDDAADKPWEIKIEIYSVAGRLVKKMFNRSGNREGIDYTKEFETDRTPNSTSARGHEIYWDGLDDKGNEVANGVYFYIITIKGKDTNQETISEKYKGKLAKIRTEQ